MQLNVWQADFGIPSIEPESLQFLAASKFCAAQVRVVNSETRPWRSPNGDYPTFIHTQLPHAPPLPDGTPPRSTRIGVHQDAEHGIEIQQTITDFDDFVAFLRNRAEDLTLDGHLNEAQKCEAAAYGALLKNRLLPAYLYTVWVDDANYNTVTHKWFARKLPLPYNMYYLHRKRAAAKDYLRGLYGGSDSMTKWTAIEYAVNKQAVNCFTMLSAKLEEKKYFFGDRPSSLDAQIYGYLAPLLKLPIPNDPLQVYLKSCASLVRFVETVTSIYLPLTEEELSVQRADLDEWEVRRERARDELKRSRQQSDDDDKEKAKSKSDTQEATNKDEFKMRDKILFLMGAVIATMFAAVHFGIVSIEVTNENPNDSSSEPTQLPQGIDFEKAFLAEELGDDY